MTQSRTDLRTMQKNAEAFAKSRSREFARAILTDTSMGEDLFNYYNVTRNKLDSIPYSKEDYMDLLVNDFEFIIGRFAAIAYAVGFDASSNKDQVTELVTEVKPMEMIKKKAGQPLDKKIIFPESFGPGADRSQKK